MSQEVTDDYPVSADPVADSLITTTGTDHVTVEGTDPDATVGFYRDVLGMRLVLRQPNLDRPELTHLFFDTGDGRLLTVFVSPDRETADGHSAPPGAVHHLAFRVETEAIPTIKQRLESAGHPVSEFDRGAFHALYTEDPNGLTIELVGEKYDIPDDRRGAVLARAHHERIADGADFVEDRHVEAALDALGLDADRIETPGGAAGRGVE